MSEKEIRKEAREHPELVRKYGIEIAVQIARDHAKRKTTSKEGKRIYMRDYMREKRQPLRMPSASAALGFQPKSMGKRMSQKDFDVVYRSLFVNVKPPPKVKFKDPNRW